MLQSSPLSTPQNKTFRPSSPNSANKGLVGFTRKLFNYVTGTPPPLHNEEDGLPTEDHHYLNMDPSGYPPMMEQYGQRQLEQPMQSMNFGSTNFVSGPVPPSPSISRRRRISYPNPELNMSAPSLVESSSFSIDQLSAPPPPQQKESPLFGSRSMEALSSQPQQADLQVTIQSPQQPNLTVPPPPVNAPPVLQSPAAAYIAKPRNDYSLETPAKSIAQPASLSEFDPLVIPKDWMMQFTSPEGNPIQQQQQQPQQQQQVKEGANLLIDDLAEPLSPLSMPKYSQREWQEEKQKLESELQLLKRQIEEGRQQVLQSEQAREDMKKVVQEYEQTMQTMIDTSRVEKERNKIKMEKLTEEKQRVQLSLHTLESSYNELRTRYEEMKQQNEAYRKQEGQYKQTVEQLQKDVQNSEQRVGQLKTHAEHKLEEANKEIQRVQHHYEKEISLMKAKLQKSELKIKSLESTIEHKQTENAELMAICDDLIKKMEHP